MNKTFTATQRVLQVVETPLELNFVELIETLDGGKARIEAAKQITVNSVEWTDENPIGALQSLKIAFDYEYEPGKVEQFKVLLCEWESGLPSDYTHSVYSMFNEEHAMRYDEVIDKLDDGTDILVEDIEKMFHHVYARLVGRA